MASVPTYVTSRLAKVTEGGVVRDEEDSWHGFRGTEWQEILVAVCCSEKDIKDAWAVGLETFLDTIAGYEEGGIGPTFWYIKPEAAVLSNKTNNIKPQGKERLGLSMIKGASSGGAEKSSGKLLACHWGSRGRGCKTGAWEA